MEEIKEIKINIPDGYEIDKEKSSFEHIVFKKKENKLPTTWEEFCENYPIKIGEVSINSYSIIVRNSRNREPHADKNYLPSKELAEAMLALCQLIQLRDCYNAGWKPDWEHNYSKYCIVVHSNTVYKDVFLSCNKILAFKTEGLRDQFYDNFKDLIEIAKSLL